MVGECGALLSDGKGRKPIHNADEIMAEIVARRLVEHLGRAGLVVMEGPGRLAARRCWGGDLIAKATPKDLPLQVAVLGEIV